jgi:2-succinyl-5-enolpyruvyl-6-hydroxy-3-cyclohexene-1-carboxylate synthase
VVINNNGGGIFSFLPIAQYKEVFEPFFATPHDLRFEHAARMYGLKYTVVTDGSSFQKAYQTALDQDHHSIIEVQTNREENYTMHRNLLSQLIEKVEHLMD